MRKRKTDDTSVLFGQIVRLSLIFGAAGSAIALFFGIRAFAGLWAGVLMCVAGLAEIRRFCTGQMSQSAGFISYLIRYAFYGLVTYAVFALNLSIFAFFAGIALQKAAIVCVPLLRKEGGHGAN